MSHQEASPKRPRTPQEQRRRKLRKIRAAVRVGVYENDLKLEIAIDRLLNRLPRRFG